MIRSDRKWCNFFPFKAAKPTVLNIQWDAFSTNKSGAATLIDGVKASRETGMCFVNRLRNTKTDLYRDIRCSNNTFI